LAVVLAGTGFAGVAALVVAAGGFGAGFFVCALTFEATPALMSPASRARLIQILVVVVTLL
jgi:hypothetical protein